MSKPMKIGILGCGHISNTYFENAAKLDDIEVIACADISEAAAKEKAEKFNIPAVSVDELLKHPDIEMIVNLTIPAAHADLAVRTLENGKHSYGEKPLAITLADGKRILETAKKKNLRVGSAPDTFLGGGLQTCRKMIDDGWIGRPLSGTAIMMGYGPERFYHPRPAFFFQQGGGPLLDVGVYYVTSLVHLLGPVKKVCAVTTKGYETRIAGPQAVVKYERIPVEVPTHYAGVLEFCNGAVISLIASFDVWKHGHHPIELYGTEGSMQVPDPNMFGGPVMVQRERGNWQECPLAFGYAENFRALGAADMANAIRNNRPARCSGELAYHVLDVMLALETASDGAKHVEIQSTCEQPAPLPLGLREGRVEPLE